MARSKPELVVQDSCCHRLDYWKSLGIVLDYLNISDLGKKCFRGVWIMSNRSKVKGRNDLLAYIKHNNRLSLYIIECKEPKGGVWDEDQKNYARLFDGLENVIYEVVTSPKQIDVTIDRITNYTQNSLDSITI